MRAEGLSSCHSIPHFPQQPTRSTSEGDSLPRITTMLPVAIRRSLGRASAQPAMKAAPSLAAHGWASARLPRPIACLAPLGVSQLLRL